MTEYKKLYNQIDKLNNKIKKLESTLIEKKNITSNRIVSNQTSKSTLMSYRIYFPKDSYSNKKYIGLKFDDNPNDYDSDDKSANNLIPFIKLSKSNIIINYNILFELNFTSLESIILTIALGIKSQLTTDSKIRIIKGTKHTFDLNGPNVINNKLNIANNVLYSADENDELCMIIDYDCSPGSNCVLNSKKSIIKLLFV